MQPIATENALINNHRIAHAVFGSGDPVVLLHGTPSSSLIWRNVIPELVDAGFKVHIFDLLGYGQSERPWDPAVDTSMTGQVSILEGLLELWQLTSIHIVAHDIGGGVAQRFAIFSPERVRTLTLVDVVCFDSYPSKRTKQQMEKGLQTLIKAEDDQHKEHFRTWLLSAVHNQERFVSSSLDTFLGYISNPMGQASLFQHQIRHYDPKHTMEVASRYQELGKMPVKLIWGADDTWQVTDWAHKLHEAIPNSELDIVKDAGHFSPEDQPKKISEFVVLFLNRHAQTT